VSHGHQKPAASAIVQVIRTVHLLVVCYRHNKIGRDEHYSPAKFRRRYAENRKRMLVKLSDTAHRATIIVKMAVPICVTEHDIRSAVRAMLIGGVEETAEIRLNP
jgi:hypothetical protein